MRRLSTPAVLAIAAAAVLVVVAATVAIALAFIDDDDPAEAVAPTASTSETLAADDPFVAELAPYVDAVVAATSPGLSGLASAAGIDDAPYRCLVQQMLQAVGLDRLQAAGATPETMRGYPSLAAAGFTLDLAAVDQLVADAGACGVGPYVGGVLISGLAAPGPDGAPLASPAGTDCFVATIGSDPTFTPALVDQLLGIGDPSAAINTATISAYAGCPVILVDLLLGVYEGTGVTVTDDDRACIEAETGARAEAVATAVVGRDQAMTRALGEEIAAACL